MVRPSDYTQRRRVAMQAVLCVALGLTIALAWWVSRSRAGGLEVKLGTTQRYSNTVMNLTVRVPLGWKAAAYYENGEPRLIASEPQTKHGLQRILLIDVRREQKADEQLPSPEDVGASQMDGRVFSPPARKFDFLGHPGVILEYPAIVEEKLLPALCARTVIPGPKAASVTLVLQLEAFRPFIRADFELLESVAKSLKRIDSAIEENPPTTKPTHDLQ